jgi:hypothetical protein
MGRWVKTGIVLAGYAAAFAAGGWAGWAYDRRMAAMPYDTSGGMYAGGEMMTVLGVFLPVALVPTLLALWFLRHHLGFWKLIANTALAWAVVGLVAVLAPLVFRGHVTAAPVVLLQLMSVTQMLGVPLWLAGLALLAYIAPTHEIRRTLRTAVIVELVIAACAAIHWFVPLPPF